MPKNQVSDIFYITGWGGHLLGFGDIRTSGLCLLYLNTPRIVAQAYITKKHKFMTETIVGYDTFQKKNNSSEKAMH